MRFLVSSVAVTFGSMYSDCLSTGSEYRFGATRHENSSACYAHLNHLSAHQWHTARPLALAQELILFSRGLCGFEEGYTYKLYNFQQNGSVRSGTLIGHTLYALT